MIMPTRRGSAQTRLGSGQDKQFAQEMIKHHEMAVDMARRELELGSHPRMKALARRIITAQLNEIVILRRFLETETRRG